MAGPRDATIDIAKGIGIVLVVLGHSPTVARWGPTLQLIYSFHMPLFFVLSGAVLKASGSVGSFAAARFHAVLKPYLVVCVAMVLAKSFGAFSGMAGADEAWRFIAGLLYGTGTTVMWTPLWYLPHFFAASCASFLLLKALGHRPAVATGISALLLVVGVWAIGRLGEWPWSADLLPISVALMLAGWRWRQAILSANLRWRPCAAAVLAFLALHQLSGARLDMNARIWDNLFVCTAEATLGICLVIAAARALQRSALATRAFAYLGSVSLFILVFHHPVHARALQALQARGVNDTAAALFAVAAGVLLPLLVWEAARRIRPMAWMLLPRPKVTVPAAGA